MIIDVQRLPIEVDYAYPISDGQPIADNTRQFRWIMTIQGGLDALFQDDPDVFVAGDLLWYPVQGKPKICRAPDVLVAFGRPKIDRGAYLQWQEADIAPQVVFEILSPSNTPDEMAAKFDFYTTYGVEEYYLYDPDTNAFSGWLRSGQDLHLIEPINGWVSPRLGIRFELQTDRLSIIRPNGEDFLTYANLDRQRQQERQRAELFAAKLRTLGIDPDTLT